MSLLGCVDIEQTREALVAHVRAEFAAWPTMDNFHFDQLRVSPYYGDDDRIGWRDVHIVTIDGYGVVGFTEGPV